MKTWTVERIAASLRGLAFMLMGGTPLLTYLSRSTLNSDIERLCAVLVLAGLGSRVAALIASRLQHERILMADRLAALGGALEVASAPSSGTTVAGSVPADEVMA